MASLRDAHNSDVASRKSNAAAVDGSVAEAPVAFIAIIQQVAVELCSVQHLPQLAYMQKLVDALSSFCLSLGVECPEEVFELLAHAHRPSSTAAPVPSAAPLLEHEAAEAAQPVTSAAPLTGGWLTFFPTQRWLSHGGHQHHHNDDAAVPVPAQRWSVWTATHMSRIADTLWPASFALIDAAVALQQEYDNHQRALASTEGVISPLSRGLFAGRHALELGSGTGLAGLVLASLLNRTGTGLSPGSAPRRNSGGAAPSSPAENCRDGHSIPAVAGASGHALGLASLALSDSEPGACSRMSAVAERQTRQGLKDRACKGGGPTSRAAAPSQPPGCARVVLEGTIAPSAAVDVLQLDWCALAAEVAAQNATLNANTAAASSAASLPPVQRSSSSSGNAAACIPSSWSSSFDPRIPASISSLRSRCSVLLGSDLVYYPEVIPGLAGCLSALLVPLTDYDAGVGVDDGVGDALDGDGANAGNGAGVEPVDPESVDSDSHIRRLLAWCAGQDGQASSSSSTGESTAAAPSAATPSAPPTSPLSTPASSSRSSQPPRWCLLASTYRNPDTYALMPQHCELNDLHYCDVTRYIGEIVEKHGGTVLERGPPPAAAPVPTPQLPVGIRTAPSQHLADSDATRYNEGTRVAVIVHKRSLRWLDHNFR